MPAVAPMVILGPLVRFVAEIEECRGFGEVVVSGAMVAAKIQPPPDREPRSRLPPGRRSSPAPVRRGGGHIRSGSRSPLPPRAGCRKRGRRDRGKSWQESGGTVSCRERRRNSRRPARTGCGGCESQRIAGGRITGVSTGCRLRPAWCGGSPCGGCRPCAGSTRAPPERR